VPWVVGGRVRSPADAGPGAAQAELGQDLVGVLAGRRDRTHHGLIAVQRGGRDQRLDRPHRRRRRTRSGPRASGCHRGVPARTAAALESIGYHLVTGIDPRNQAAHRFTRGIGHVDLLTSDEDGDEVDELEVQKHVKKQDEQQSDIVDVLVADHAAPSVEEMLRGKAMVKVEGATQALRRTVNVVLEITPGVPTTISVPGPFGALILKAAAYQTDSRDRERHLYDAAAFSQRPGQPSPAYRSDGPYAGLARA
jgi:hypothetical protein